MPRLSQRWTFTLIFALLPYATVAFANLEPNPLHWEDGFLRGIIVVFGLFLGVAAYTFPGYDD